MKPEHALKSALLSLFTNLAYSFYNGLVGVLNHSWWFVTLAAYYAVLSIIRFAVLVSNRRSGDGNARGPFLMRITGILFLFLAVTLAGTTYLAFSEQQGIRRHEIVIITIALYAFVKLALGVINLIKSRTSDSPVLKTLRNISFADGLVSIFSLQRSMLASFEGMSPENISLFNALTGSAVYLIVFLLGIHLIGGKRIAMAESKFIKANQKIAGTVTDGYKKLEKGVVDGYKKIENGVVEGYAKIEDKCIEQFLTREGETVEEARNRLRKKEY